MTNEPRNTRPTWAQWLKAALDRNSMTGADLHRAGVVSSASTISKWLNGTSDAPGDAETVIVVAHAVGYPNAIEALEVAGMDGVASEIRKQIRGAHEDQALLKIRNNRLLTADQKAAIEGNYRRRLADATQLMEIEIAEAVRRARVQRDGRTLNTETESSEAAEA